MKSKTHSEGRVPWWSKEKRGVDERRLLSLRGPCVLLTELHLAGPESLAVAQLNGLQGRGELVLAVQARLSLSLLGLLL